MDVYCFMNLAEYSICLQYVLKNLYIAECELHQWKDNYPADYFCIYAEKRYIDM